MSTIKTINHYSKILNFYMIQNLIVQMNMHYFNLRKEQ